MRATTRTSVLALAAGLVFVLVAPTHAERANDRDDSRGPFDLASLRQTQRDGDRLLFVLTTHEPWTTDRVRNGGFSIRVDSDPDPEFDRYVLIEWQNTDGPGGRLRARIVLPTGETIDRQPARHPRPRRLALWINRKVLGIERGAFRINAYSVFYADWCPRDGCRDYVPNEGTLRVSFGGLCAGDEPDITGTPGDDQIRTRGNRVVVAALGGDDAVTVKSGSAVVCAGGGRDVLTGGTYADLIRGGGGNDELSLGGAGRRPNRGYGGGGNDVLYGGRDRDWLFGQSGDDYLEGRGSDDFLDGGRGRDDLNGGGGTDTCTDGQSTGGC